MILNIEEFFKTKLSAEDFLTLLIIQNKAYTFCEHRRDSLLSLHNIGLVEAIKGKPKDPKYLKARLTKKAKNLLRDLEIPGITEEVKEVGTELIALYEARGYDKKVGNKRNVMRLLAWFMQVTECSPVAITQAVDKYLGESDETYTSSLENVIYKAPNLFATKPDLEHSKLLILINNA